MPSRFDVYALAPARDAGTIDRFVARWAGAPGREPSWSARGVAAPAALADALALAVKEPAAAFVVEIEPHDHRLPTSARLAFTGDRKLILGLSVDDDDPGDAPLRSAKELLAALRDLHGCLLGFIGQDEPPPPNALALKALVDGLEARGESSAFFRL